MNASDNRAIPDVATEPDRVVALLALLHQSPGSSFARACKQLQISASELWRLLGEIDGSSADGLDLVNIIDRDGHPRLRLTTHGERLCDGSQ